MTDEWRALHIGEDHPPVDVPNPRVIHISDRRSGRARPEPPPPGAPPPPETVGPEGTTRPEPPPQAARVAEVRNGFVRRAVSYLAADAGVRQFLDVGSGLPAGDDVLRAARAHAPDARAVHVRSDATAPRRGRAPARERAMPVVAMDGMRPGALIDHLRLRGLVDPDDPVAVLLTDPAPLREDGVLAHDIVRALHSGLCRGSHVVIAQDVPDPGDPHCRELAAALFEPFRLLEPGLADLAWWPYPDDEVSAEPTGVLAGMGRKD